LNIASGLIDAPEEEEKVIPAKRARALTTTTTAAKKRKAAAEFVPVRKSSRVAGNTISAEELEISREKEAELERNEYERVKKIKHDDRGMEESILSSVDGSGGVEDCLEMMKTLVQKVGEEKVKQEEDRDGQTKGRGRTTPKKSTTVIEEDDSKPGTSLSALKGILAKCELRSIVKVVPERIYSLVVQ
jgi:Fic family protein